MRKSTLLSEILAVNALVVMATVFAATAAAQLDLDLPQQRGQYAVLLVAVCVTLLANGFMLRRRLRPLEQLIATTERVDLADPGVRALPGRGDIAEVARLKLALNRMLDRLEEERRDAGRAVLDAQERERARIARDLHDEVNQALTGILLRLQASGQDAPPALKAELAETQSLATQAMDELLRLARELRPAALDDHGLLPAVERQIREWGAHTGVAATFEVREDEPALSPDEQLVAYRVVQEALSNIAQHAGASHVSVTLLGGHHPGLRIRDDGWGFEQGSTDRHGLSGMAERALAVGARLDVRSAPGMGTTVRLTFGGGA